jgi:hypothetical protein
VVPAAVKLPAVAGQRGQADSGMVTSGVSDFDEVTRTRTVEEQ